MVLRSHTVTKGRGPPCSHDNGNVVLIRIHLDSMAEGRGHPDVLSDSIHDAPGNPGCCKWAAGCQKRYASSGTTSPLSGGHVHSGDRLAFGKAMLVQDLSVWEELHIMPGGAPPQGAKLCMYLRWLQGLTTSTESPIMSCPFR